jgi:hypothetical protein
MVPGTRSGAGRRRMIQVERVFRTCTNESNLKGCRPIQAIDHKNDMLDPNDPMFWASIFEAERQFNKQQTKPIIHKQQQARVCSGAVCAARGAREVAAAKSSAYAPARVAHWRRAVGDDAIWA